MDTRDYFVEVQRGNIAGHSIVSKFGRNDSVPNGVWQLVSLSSPSGAFPASGTPVRIKAGGDAADTANGAGAREITLIGIDTNLAEVSETLATSGSGASAYTTTSFWRVYRSFVSSVGTYGVNNTGNIVVENAGDDALTITAGEGQTQHGAFAIPIGKVGYLLSVDIDTDATKRADFRLFVRENFNDFAAPMSPSRVKLHWDGVLGPISYRPRSPIVVIPALSDIWIEAEGDGANTDVSVDFEILLIDDPTGPIKKV